MTEKTTPITPLQYEIEKKIGIPKGSLTQSRLQEWQLEKLNETLAFIRKNSPFYREKFIDLPDNLSSLEELQRFPFTTADDIATDNMRMICVPQDQIARIITLDTSGTTGKSKRLFFTKEDQQLTINFFGIGQTTLVKPGYHELILLPGTTPGSVGDLLQKGLQQEGVTGIPCGPFTDPHSILNRIEKEKIDNLCGAPKQILTLVRTWQKERRGKCPIQSIMLTTDYVAPALMRQIAEIWDCFVLQHYGMTEAGLGVGMDCSAVRGSHLRDADMFFEIVHPKTGRPCQPGERGEVVFTTLTRKGMPLIRYRSKDLSRFIPGDCPCGTVLRTLQWVRGRTDDLSLPCSMPDLDDILFSFPTINGFDASLSGTHLFLELYWQEIPSPSEQKIIEGRLYETLPKITAIDCQMKTGFPDSAFSLAKKRIHVLPKSTGT